MIVFTIVNSHCHTIVIVYFTLSPRPTFKRPWICLIIGHPPNKVEAHAPLGIGIVYNLWSDDSTVTEFQQLCLNFGCISGQKIVPETHCRNQKVSSGRSRGSSLGSVEPPPPPPPPSYSKELALLIISSACSQR